MNRERNADAVLDLDADFFQAPRHYLDLLRSRGPAARVRLPSGTTAWFVTDFAEAQRLLADPRLSKAREQRLQVAAKHGAPAPVVQAMSALSSHLLTCDPPDHTRLRALVNRAFTARRIDSLRPRIEQIATTLADRMAAGDEVDLLSGFAYPLPLAVIGDMLGVPTSGRAPLRQWLDLLFAVGRSRADQEQAAHAFLSYVKGLVARARSRNSDDLIGALVSARDGQDRLSEDELVSSVGLLISAGYETTVNLIGNAMANLLTAPDRWAAVTCDPDLVPDAIEETLRLDAPVYLATARFTLEDVRCGSVVIPADEIVHIALLAANTDPTRFPEPDAYRLGRGGPGNLAFGHGIHFCLGASLARLEAEAALRTLLARFPGMRLLDAESLRWRPSLVVHGLQTLPVRLIATDVGPAVAASRGD